MGQSMGQNGLSILVIDDLAVHRMLMREGLKRMNPGCEISEACCVEEAKSILLSGQHFDAVVSDRSMPGEDGTELVKWMRRMPCFNRTAFVMISGRIQPEDIISAFMEANVDGYVTKPFGLDDLQLKLISTVSRRRSPVLAYSAPPA
ncbi:response regulator [Dechloromonas sp. ZS-1]|uniref:response regulator n=1 Tax=Dechloromonas sp. ZS-1 TaxID=3138067 RepID=UPI0031FC532F